MFLPSQGMQEYAQIAALNGHEGVNLGEVLHRRPNLELTRRVRPRRRRRPRVDFGVVDAAGDVVGRHAVAHGHKIRRSSPPR
jgi:hypothetical protein